MGTQTVGIFIFDEVEVMDFAGPFEVFALAEQEDAKCFSVKTISPDGKLIRARNGLKVVPDYSFINHKPLDILIVPGGYGAEHIQINNPESIQWIQSQFEHVNILASVCTGALLLAKAGLLENIKATTHWMDIKRLRKEFPSTRVVENERFVDEGRIITSGGISAGIDMSFHILKRQLGQTVAQITADRMEYNITIQ